MIKRSAAAILLVSVVFPLASYGTDVQDPNAPVVTRTVVGIEKPQAWNSIPYRYIGSMVVTTKSGVDASGATGILGRRLDATVTMNSDRILEGSIEALAIRLNIARNGIVIANCELDRSAAIGSQTTQLGDYSAVLIKRADAPIQAISGYCNTIDEATGDAAPGIPAIDGSEIITLDTAGTTLQSQVADASQ